MITLSKFKSAIIQAGKRILKVDQYGAKTAEECAPFGDDSNPVKNLTAVYASTGENSEPVIIGYINDKQLAKIGEKRLYSLDSTNNLAAYLWLTNSGDLELNGDADFAVRHSALNTSLQNEVNLLNAELTKVQASIAALGGTYVRLPVEITIDSAKVETVKLP